MRKDLRTKLIGLGALVLTVLLIAGVLLWRNTRPEPMRVETVTGYLGGEKTGLFDDLKFQQACENAGLDVDYRKAGSLAMMDADKTGMDYLFPSSRVAVEYGELEGVDTSRADIVFNSPIVVYTHRAVADALTTSGIMSRDGDTYRLDMNAAIQAMLADKTWQDVGWADGYGQFRIDSTDPVESNSGNMYAALVATVLNGGQPATVDSVNRDADNIKHIFAKSGWMDTSSEDSFNSFLTLGVGSKPMMVGYESQLLDLAVNQPDTFEQVKDDIIMAYPTPTVWSTHMLIPLTDNGERLLDLLESDDMQKLAWERHGFRSASQTGATPVGSFGVTGALDQITGVAELPGNDAMQQLIKTLKTN